MAVDILNGMCEEKERMKGLPENDLGSWKRTVGTSDGVWPTRGHFSKNGSLIMENYMSSGQSWSGHKCRKGSDDIVEEEVNGGMAKSMEGRVAEECYGKAMEEGCGVEVVWQNGDSSSSLSVEKHYGKGKVFKCGRHVGRAHGNNVKDLATLKEFPTKMQQDHKQKFQEIQSANCACKRHSQKCGCISDQFIQTARSNHFCWLQQCKDPEEYARWMRALGAYHCRDIHYWGGGECGFHPSISFSCGSCDDDITC